MGDHVEMRPTPLILDGTFFRISSSEDNGKVKAICVTCESTLKKADSTINGAYNPTSNFVTHLKRKHPEVYKTYEGYVNDPELKAKRKKQPLLGFPVKNFVSKSTATKTQTEEALLEYIIMSMSPLCTVEDPYFRTFCKRMNPDTSIMCEETLVSRISGEFHKKKMLLLKEMEAVRWICTTADVWSSNSRSYLGVTAHWLNEEFERKSVVLCLKRFPGEHTNEKIAEMLQEIFTEYGIHHKIIAVVSDNGSNFVKAFKDFGLDVSMEPSEFDMYDSANLVEIEEIDMSLGLPPHIRCASHTMSLIATQDVEKDWKTGKPILHKKTMRSSLSKCTALWNKASRSNKLSESIKNLAGKMLKTPVVTRWNSVFDSVQRLLDFEPKLDGIFALAGISKLTELEIEFLHEYHRTMEFVASALDTLQSEKDFYYGYLAPIIINLISELERCVATPSSNGFAASLATNLLEGVKFRFGHIVALDLNQATTEIFAACSFPLFRLRWIPEIHRDKIRMAFIQEAIKFNTKPTASAYQKNGLDTNTNKWDKMFGVTSSESWNSEESAEVEAIRFLSDPDQTIKCLKHYPTIKQMFYRYNTILPSSASAERLFSYGGMVLRPKRNQLGDEMFEKLVMLKLNWI